ncbi:MAG: class I SAM-dependent methyltransferase [Syntrophales bacterium]|nr:class I SAM-dependent methyltransferase [Syntrophales bacterium]
MIFDEETARSYDDWLLTPVGRYIDRREKDLIFNLIAPREGERLLDVGCGTGNHLRFFRRKGCNVTGLESSPSMLDIARKKLGQRADFHMGKAEDLPFSDNEFDIVTMITSVEFMDNPQKAIAEAIRVCRDRVFIGVLNKHSIIGVRRRITRIFSTSIYNSARFFGIGELTQIVKTALPGVNIRWGSVIFLPFGWYSFATGLEEIIPVMNNPFGAFIGLSFPVVFTHRTIQDIVKSHIKVGTEGKHKVHGAVREIKR